jgi:Protein of unknown function (DUF1573)
MKKVILSLASVVLFSAIATAQTKTATKAKQAVKQVVTKQVNANVPSAPAMPPTPPAMMGMPGAPGMPPGMPAAPGAMPNMPAGAPGMPPQVNTVQAAAAQATQIPNEIETNAKFDKTEHDFGKVTEGPQATTEFSVKNIGKEPLTISNVQASCGCTVPSWTKEPIAPGATGNIKAIYNTQGRPGPFTKSLTVSTSKGTKVLTIKGLVEKAPDTSVPAPVDASPIKSIK